MRQRNLFSLRLLGPIFTCLLVAIPALSQDLLVKGGRVYTMAEQGVLQSGDILIRNGKIVEVGSSITAPAGVKVIEAKNGYVLPGLIDAHSHMDETMPIRGHSELKTPFTSQGITTFVTGNCGFKIVVVSKINKPEEQE